MRRPPTVPRETEQKRENVLPEREDEEESFGHEKKTTCQLLKKNVFLRFAFEKREVVLLPAFLCDYMRSLSLISAQDEEREKNLHEEMCFLLLSS